MKTVEIINELLKQRGISAAKMMNELGFSSGLYSQWKSGKQRPSWEKLIKIADYFGVSMDYLLGKKTEISKNEENGQKNNATDNSDIPGVSSTLNISDSELTDILNRLSDKSLSELESYLDYLLWKQDQES